MESADVLDDELAGSHRELATKSDLLAMEERLKRYIAKQTNKVIAFTLGGAAIWVAIISILVAVS